MTGTSNIAARPCGVAGMVGGKVEAKKSCETVSPMLKNTMVVSTTQK